MASASNNTPPFGDEGARVQAIARFHSGLAHDLNNRLTTILGNLLLFEGLFPKETEALSDMRYAADQACNLVRLVQTFTKREPLRPHPVSVNEVLRTLHDLLQRLLGPACRVSMLLSDAPRYVFGDEGALEQMLVELVGSGRPNQEVFLQVIDGAGGVVLAGEGMECVDVGERLAALLAYFGAVLESQPTGWRIRFPVCDFESAVPPESPLPGAGIRVLLAEGDPVLRGCLGVSLRAGGFEVTEAADVLHVGALLSAGGDFDVAALDVQLPGGGMASLLPMEKLPDPRLWLLPFAEALPVEKEACLAKPFTPLALHRALRMACG